MSINMVFAQKENNLAYREQMLASLAGLEAKGDMPRLSLFINQSLDREMTVAELKEAFVQLYAYTGFPRSLNALTALQSVIDKRKAENKPTRMGDDGEVLPKNFDSLGEGTKVQQQLLGGGTFTYAFSAREDYFLKTHLFGDIFAGKALSHTDRELVTVGALTSLEGCESQLTAHVSGALNMGVSKEKLRSLPAIVAANVGAIEGFRLGKVVSSVLNVPFDGAEMSPEASVWPKGELNPYNKYFTGKSYLAPLGGEKSGLFNVTFEPGCRNFWHVHHGHNQVLICVSGRGWYQEWGKPAVELKPGMVITVPEGVKHWHGAAQDSWFQHLGFSANVQPTSSTEWLEPVSEVDYGKLK